MNADEIKFMLKTAVRGYLDPETIRASENEESSGLRQSNAIRDLFDQLQRFVDDDAYHEECLVQAEWFVSKNRFRPALHACLTKYWINRDRLDAIVAKKRALIAQGGKMAELTAHESGADQDADTLTALAHRIRAKMLTALCKFNLALETDQRLEAQVSFERCVAQMQAITEAMKLAFPQDEELYYLVYNGTIYLYSCCQKMMRLGYYKQSALFIGWCVRSSDAIIKLSSTNYLEWRVRLYTALCACYEASHEYHGAHTVAGWLQSKVEDLNDLEMLDVVPPSEKQLAILQNALDISRTMTLKYAWCAALVDGEAAEKAAQAHDKGKKGGKSAAADDSHSAAVPTSGAELLEKVKTATHSGAGSYEAVTRALLSILSDATTRIFASNIALKIPAGRQQLQSLAVDALRLHVVPVVDDYNRRNNLAEKEWAGAELPNEDVLAAGAKKDKQADKKQAGKGAKKEDEAAVSVNPSAIQLEEAFSAQQLLQILRAFFLYTNAATFAFKRTARAVLHRYDVINPAAILETEILDRVFDVAHCQPGSEESAHACQVLAETLLHAVSTGDGSFPLQHPDLVEDAALQLLDSWGQFPHCHEKDGAGIILEAAAIALVKSDHSDTLLVGNTALTASRSFKAAGDTKRSLLVAAAVESFLRNRQIAFVFSHNNTGEETDTMGETVTLRHAVTLHDGVWLRNLRDIRTELHRVICALRLQKAIDEKHDVLKSEHDERVRLLKVREEESHLYGELTKKDKRAITTVAEEEVPRPNTVVEMENKLLAWSHKEDDIATALALCEIALCQKTPVEQKKKLETALESLQKAAASHIALMKKLKLTRDTLVEPTTASGLSLYMGWSVFAHYCARCKAHDLILPAREALFKRFVQLSDVDHKVWNRNLCAWDSLRQERFERCSGHMAQWLADGFDAIAQQQLLSAPYVSPIEYADTNEEGLDKRRYTAAERERNNLRTANILLHALDFSVSAADDPSTVRICHSLFNCLLPLLTAENKPAILLRPLAAILHAIRTFADRRWSDGPLQLLAVRVLAASFELLKALPDVAQRGLTTMFTNAFCDVWQRVLNNPNDQQRRHIARVENEIKFSKNVLQAQQEAQKNQEATQPEAPVKGGKGKKGDKGNGDRKG